MIPRFSVTTLRTYIVSSKNSICMIKENINALKLEMRLLEAQIDRKWRV